MPDAMAAGGTLAVACLLGMAMRRPADRRPDRHGKGAGMSRVTGTRAAPRVAAMLVVAVGLTGCAADAGDGVAPPGAPAAQGGPALGLQPFGPPPFGPPPFGPPLYGAPPFPPPLYPTPAYPPPLYQPPPYALPGYPSPPPVVRPPPPMAPPSGQGGPVGGGIPP